MARPVVRLEEGSNPRYLISPGLIADSTTHILVQYYEAEITVTELLNQKTPERNYGDVDVFAWKPDQDEVLAIECKDLKLTKTPNEMAEQLN